jgi:hypothetical protein
MKVVRLIVLVCLAVACSGCITQYPDPAIPYAQRIDTVTLGAGDAQDVNTATQMIDPWPPYAANRRIPGNGPRMVGAVERYEGSGKAQGPAGATAVGGATATGGGAPPLYPLAPITPGANQ